MILPTISSIFMAFAWDGPLKFRRVPLLEGGPVRLRIAFFGYGFQVPAIAEAHTNSLGLN